MKDYQNINKKVQNLPSKGMIFLFALIPLLWLIFVLDINETDKIFWAIVTLGVILIATALNTLEESPRILLVIFSEWLLVYILLSFPVAYFTNLPYFLIPILITITTFLIVQWQSQRSPINLLLSLTALISVIFLVLIESLNYNLSSESFMVSHLLYDLLGVIIGAILAFIYTKIVKPENNPFTKADRNFIDNRRLKINFINTPKRISQLDKDLRETKFAYVNESKKTTTVTKQNTKRFL